MKIPKQVVETIEAKFVRVHAKLSDSGSYSLLDSESRTLADSDGYVPGFFPTEHCGDYLDLIIDLESGQILNWIKPDAEDVGRYFGLIKESE